MATRAIPNSPQIGQGYTLWTDVTGAYYVRQDTINNTSSLLQTTWYNAKTGKKTKPGSSVTPVNATVTTLVTQNLYQLLVDLPYSMGLLGDTLIHYIVYDIVSTSYFVVWIDITKGAVLPPQYYPTWAQVVLVADTRNRKRVQAPAHLVLTDTSETELIPAHATAYHDIHSLTVANNGAVDLVVDLRSATGGAVLLSVAVKVGDTAHLDFAAAQLKQAAINTAWTAQASAASDVRITAVYGTSA